MEFRVVEPVRYNKKGKKEDNEIRAIFYEHWEKMKNQTETVMNDINAWRSRMTNEIDTYANEQIHALEAIYNRQRAVFGQIREENISIAVDLRKSKTNDVFNELRNGCRLLQFQVAQLEDVQYQIQRPRVIAIEDQTEGNTQNQSNTHAIGSQDSRMESTTNKTNVTEKRGSNSSRSLQPPNNGTSEALTTASSNTNNRSMKERNNSNTIITNVQGVNNECPICSMIFPLYMSENDCQQHVEEHGIDGEGANSEKF